MKKIILLVSILLFSNQANAESFFDHTILGVSFFNQTLKSEITGAGATQTISDSGSGVGIYPVEVKLSVWIWRKRCLLRPA